MTYKLEIKCKKCGKITLYKNFFPRQVPVSFALTVNELGMITEACHDAEALLEYPRQELIGKSVADICPSLRDGDSRKNMLNSLAANAPYKIENNTFLINGGGKISPESIFISRSENGTPVGYQVFNWLAYTGKNP